MIAFFLIVAIVPLIASFIAYIFLDGVTWKEFLCIIAMTLVVSGICAGVVSYVNVTDVELHNSFIVNKKQQAVSCSHSYQCMCVTTCTGGKDNSCTTICQTCYEHLNDYDWNIYTSTNEAITIDRIDRQGLFEPQRFTQVKIGEPATISHAFTNYIKASPGTLFRHQGLKQKYESSIPEYPVIFDYYNVNRVITVGFDLKDHDSWNNDLSIINSRLGARKQVNMIIILAKNKPNEWYYALEDSWIGGKKNDAVLVINVDDNMKPLWTKVMAWTTNELFKIKLRDDIMDKTMIDRGTVVSTFEKNVDKFYARKPMKDFEYLSSQVTPSTTEWIVSSIISLVVSLCLILYFQENDIFYESESTLKSLMLVFVGPWLWIVFKITSLCTYVINKFSK